MGKIFNLMSNAEPNNNNNNTNNNKNLLLEMLLFQSSHLKNTHYRRYKKAPYCILLRDCKIVKYIFDNVLCNKLLPHKTLSNTYLIIADECTINGPWYTVIILWHTLVISGKIIEHRLLIKMHLIFEKSHNISKSEPKLYNGILKHS